jgi:two-component system sensor histidine kinase PilS (NtrC family)
MMFFRTILISLVLGTTILLSWLSDVDLASPSSVAMFIIIGITYLATLIYALLLRRGFDLRLLGGIQLGVDLVITSLLVHITGAAQSAFTFFFPLTVIAAAIFFFRSGALIVTGLSLLLLSSVALLDWYGLLPMPDGTRLLPTDQSAVEFARSLGLNIAGIIGISALAISLGAQLQRTSAYLASERSAAADLLVLHEDIVRSLASGLITTDLDDRVRTVNRAAEQILGLPSRHLLGAQLGEILPGLASPADSQEQSRAGRDEVVRERRGKEQILGVSISPLYDHKDVPRGRIVNFQDLTELRVMEENVKRNERLAVIGELAAGVAHEIRNPLASISGSVELLKSGPEGEDESVLMDIVLREIERLNSLITELLDYASPRPADVRAMDLCAVSRETVRVFRQDRSFEDTDVEVDAPEGSVMVRADPEKLRQVLWNLLRNAAEAASGDGGAIRVHIVEDGEEVRLEVADNGAGIPAANLPRIFDPFFTTKARGSGLGLATVYAIVQQLEGDISVSSTEGQGTRFIVHLPGAKESPNVAAS